MVIKPMIRSNICINAHPVGCGKETEHQINYVKSCKEKRGIKTAAEGGNAPKAVLVLGCSTGYGLASRIAAAFEYGAATIGVSFEKEGTEKKFAIVDAGFTELIRPALYQAHHNIENLTSNDEIEKYDVVGPICESSDCFGEDEMLPKVKRGDIIAIRSAGAYGEIMASQYNCRMLPKSIYKM